MGVRHVLRPSGSDLWFSCPASFFLCKDAERLFGVEESSVFADAGTYYHSCMENLVKGKAIERNKLGLVLAKEKEIQDYANKTYEEIIKPLISGCEDLQCERRINKEICDGWSISGQIDLMFVKDSTCYIIDYKYGKKPVNVASMQLSCYALLSDTPYDIKVGILQPRLKKCITFRDVSKSEISDLRDNIERFIETELDVTAPRCCPEPKRCKYCYGRKVCNYKI